MVMEEVIILSTLGVSLDIKSKSAFQPDGMLLAARIDGKGTVRLFDEDGNKREFEFHPTDWFRDNLKSVPPKSP